MTPWGKNLAGLLTATFFGFFLLKDTRACSCPPVSLANNFKVAKSVFYGEIMQLDVEPMTGARAKFKVKEVFKGTLKPEIVLLDKSYSTSCRLFENRSGRYVLFLSADGNFSFCNGGTELHVGPEFQKSEKELLRKVRRLKTDRL